MLIPHGSNVRIVEYDGRLAPHLRIDVLVATSFQSAPALAEWFQTTQRRAPNPSFSFLYRLPTAHCPSGSTSLRSMSCAPYSQLPKRERSARPGSLLAFSMMFCML